MLPILFKHAKNFIMPGKVDTRQAQYKGIFFDGKYAFCTNTHLLVAVPFKSEKIILDLKTGAPINLKDSIIDRGMSVIPDSMPINLEIKKSDMPTVVKNLKIANDIVKDVKYHVLDFAAENIVALDGNGSNISVPMLASGDGFPIGASINGKHLLDVFRFFNDLCNPSDPDEPVKISMMDHLPYNMKISYNSAVAIITGVKRNNR